MDNLKLAKLGMWLGAISVLCSVFVTYNLWFVAPTDQITGTTTVTNDLNTSSFKCKFPKNDYHADLELDNGVGISFPDGVTYQCALGRLMVIDDPLPHVMPVKKTVRPVKQVKNQTVHVETNLTSPIKESK